MREARAVLCRPRIAKNRLDSQFPLLYGNRFLTDFYQKSSKIKFRLGLWGLGVNFFLCLPRARASLDFGNEFSLLSVPTARPWVRFVAKVLACPLEFVEFFTSIFDKNEIHFFPVWLWWNFFLCLPPLQIRVFCSESLMFSLCFCAEQSV